MNSFNTGWLDELIAQKEQAEKPGTLLEIYKDYISRVVLQVTKGCNEKNVSSLKMSYIVNLVAKSP